MTYNLNNSAEAERAVKRLNSLIRQGKAVDISVSVGKRRRLVGFVFHLCQLLSKEIDIDSKYIYSEYFKKLACPMFFVLGKTKDEVSGDDMWILKPINDLTDYELSQCIAKFRDFADDHFGVVLPSLDELLTQFP